MRLILVIKSADFLAAIPNGTPPVESPNQLDLTASTGGACGTIGASACGRSFAFRDRTFPMVKFFLGSRRIFTR
jgi:hypothetical protein